MALTGSKLIHANSSVAAAVPTAIQMVAGQIAINSADKMIFIKDATNAIVAVASASAVAKAMSAVQTVNGQSPDGAGAVVVTPAQIGDFGVAPLDAGSKIPVAYLPAALLGAVNYQGTWDASTDTPTLPDPTTSKGYYYVVSTAGTQFGNDYAVGDWAISDGVAWGKVEAQDAVSSVNGQVGTVVLTAASVGALDSTGGALSGNLTFTGGATAVVPAPVNGDDATNKTYVDAAIAGAATGGTVTSVDVTSNSPSVLTATGGPVTTNGSIALSFATQAMNTVFAGPASGADATPTFRALSNADIAGLTLDEGTFA